MVAGMFERVWRLPLTRMLLLSLGLHVAVIMIVQPRPFPPAAEVVVISARLLDKPVADLPQPSIVPSAPEVPAVPVEPAPSPEPIPVVEAKPVIPQPAPPAQAEAAAAPPPEAPRPQTVAAPGLPSVPVMIDTNWYEARQLDVQPKALAKIEPPYPLAAQRRGVEGTVKLKLHIDEFGIVREAEAMAGEPPGMFEESALAAFKAARFVPARKDGQPVRALIYIRVRYELGD